MLKRIRGFGYVNIAEIVIGRRTVPLLYHLNDSFEDYDYIVQLLLMNEAYLVPISVRPPMYQLHKYLTNRRSTMNPLRTIHPSPSTFPNGRDHKTFFCVRTSIEHRNQDFLYNIADWLA